MYVNFVFLATLFVQNFRSSLYDLLFGIAVCRVFIGTRAPDVENVYVHRRSFGSHSPGSYSLHSLAFVVAKLRLVLFRVIAGDEVHTKLWLPCTF